MAERKILKMVKGNAFQMRVNVVRKVNDGDDDPVDLAASNNLTVNIVGMYGKKYPLPYVLGSSKGQLTVTINGTQPIGRYGFEVTGSLNGEAWRYACSPDDGFEIVYYTSEGEMGDDMSDGFVDVTATIEEAGVTLEAIEAANKAAEAANKAAQSIKTTTFSVEDETMIINKI